jgi:SAM-dependent methyltransferase
MQKLALDDLLGKIECASMRMLHFAPEPFFRELFRTKFLTYETADLFMHDVDHRVDIRDLPFDDGSFDFIYASHVLEHIDDDRAAFSEIRRVLSPNGVAVLPVPIIGDVTREYPAPNPKEHGHVRAPGLDYYRKYDFFASVDVYSSNDFSDVYQTKIKMVVRWQDFWPPKPSFAIRKYFVTILPDFVPVFWCGRELARKSELPSAAA